MFLLDCFRRSLSSSSFVVPFVRSGVSRELNGKAITPRAKSIELLYHYAMGQNDEACYPYLDEARTLNANLKRELRATGHVNFWQVWMDFTIFFF